jgi:pentatricopeptide repeat protein
MITANKGNADLQPSRFAWNARLDAHVRARAVSSCYQIVRDMHKCGVMPDSLTYDLLGDLQGLVGHPEGTTRLLRQRLEAANFTGFDTLLVSEMMTNNNDTLESNENDATRVRFKRSTSSITSNRIAELEYPLPPPTVHTFNRTIRAYKRAGDIEGATRIYRLLTELIQPPPGTPRILPNVATYNEFIAVQYQAEFTLHLELLERMRKNGIAPDVYTYHLLIKYACWTRIHWEHVERLWREMREKDIQPLGRTCKIIFRRLKRPRFEQLRKEAYEIWQATQGNSGARAKLAF